MILFRGPISISIIIIIMLEALNHAKAPQINSLLNTFIFPSFLPYFSDLSIEDLPSDG